MTVLATRRRLTIVLIAVAVLIVGAGMAWWALGRGTTGTSAGLGTRTVQAGTVEVRMTALTLDATGAVFRVEFTTHTGSVDLDPATASQLRVNDHTVQGATWTGSGPGGHHRDGTLRFTTTVPAGAGVELRITGLPQDTVGTWSAP